MTRMVLAVLLPLAASCASAAAGPPEIVVDRMACSHCGMLISEPVYAAAFESAGAGGRTFDDIGCLVSAIARDSMPGLQHPWRPPSGGRLWVHDLSSGEWIDGSAAVFVKSPTIKTPMAGGIVAFRDPSAAARAASAHRGVVVTSFAELIAHKGEVP